MDNKNAPFEKNQGNFNRITSLGLWEQLLHIRKFSLPDNMSSGHPDSIPEIASSLKTACAEEV